MTAVARARARVAALTRHRVPDDPALVEARERLAELALAGRIQRLVDSAPPLTSEQRTTLLNLFGLRGDSPIT